jgi:hypothetical protein
MPYDTLSYWRHSKIPFSRVLPNITDLACGIFPAARTGFGLDSCKILNSSILTYFPHILKKNVPRS